MTWEELEQLPDEIAEQIELWDGHPVWLRRGPSEHQAFTGRLWAALERSARTEMSAHPERCWRANFETNVFLGNKGKSDFLTPDFLVFQCLAAPYQDVRAADVLLVGEILSPSNTKSNIEAKKGRYANAGIPWYWEVQLASGSSAIDAIRAYVLELETGRLAEKVRPLRPANYILAGEWTHSDSEGVDFEFPFPIRIPWTELEY
ncbi:Uma2 family endonuclease [Nocardia sp. NPDC058058]|uniref:Uma2 family endonuclease n=1 Tax=Nocardia sp. NPDC058058 TaxID=3346317 RepID=UPI0036DCDC4F